MHRYLFALLFSSGCMLAKAQVEKATGLPVLKMKGGTFLKKNISFGNFETRQFHRSIGSFFSTRAIIPANLLKIEGVPLYHKEKRRSKDNFHFNLLQRNGQSTYVEVQALMLQNETFHLFGQQDSSFFGAANTDVLLGSIQPGIDSTTWWQIAASNLNGSKDAPQKGMITQGDKAITFERTTILLREYGDNNSIDTLFNGLHMAYRFSYKGETIAAVAYKENDRLCWMKDGVTPTIQTAVAATIAVLRLRKNIYH